MIDVFVTELAETMSAGFMLDNAACVIRIGIAAYWSEGDGGTIAPHVTDAAIVGRVRSHDN